MDPAAVCFRMGGIARTAELAAAGVPKRALAAAVARGSLVRLREGVYAHPAADESVLHAARHGGRLACTDALSRHGLWVLPDARLHVAIGPRGRRHAHHPCDADVVVHWDEPAATAGWVVGVLPALVQLSRCASAEAFLVAVESAIAGRMPKLAPGNMAQLESRLSPVRRAQLRFARPTAESGLETLVRWRLHLQGVACRSQVEVPGVGRFDLVVGDRLVIELDGREHHSSEVAFSLDRRRDAAAAALGFVTLRFSYAQVVHEWDAVEAAVLTALSGGLHETAAGRRHRAERARPL